MEITVDTSAIMAVLLNEPTKPQLIELTRDSELVSAPTLPWELGNGLTALFKRNRIDLDDAVGALEAFGRIPIRFADIELEPCIAMAESAGIYAYDAYMLECALRYRTPFLSLDRAQCEVGKRLGVEILEV